VLVEIASIRQAGCQIGEAKSTVALSSFQEIRAFFGDCQGYAGADAVNHLEESTPEGRSTLEQL
jgi:hypothetical protein